jgi:flagellar basal-body rod protein FlgB
MDSQRIFSQTVAMLERAMDLRTRKHRLVANNIANADTPNFKAFDLEIGEAMDRQGRLPMTVSQNSHVGGKGGEIAHRIVSASGVGQRKDGNSVDLDRSMTSLSQNQIMYDALTRLTAKKLLGLKIVIKGGK